MIHIMPVFYLTTWLAKKAFLLLQISGFSMIWFLFIMTVDVYPVDLLAIIGSSQVNL
jgi:hypothetical protein